MKEGWVTMIQELDTVNLLYKKIYGRVKNLEEE